MFFFFNDTAPTEIYTLSLHDALPIWRRARRTRADPEPAAGRDGWLRPALDRDPDGGVEPPRHPRPGVAPDRKSTRLNSSHANISYAVFCLKKKKQNTIKLVSIDNLLA